MKILFIKSELIGSRLIRWGLDEDCSHVAILFQSLGIVFHSYGKGMVELFAEDFFKHNTLMHSIHLAVDEKAFYEKFRPAVAGIRYDYMALTYLAWRGVLKKFFGVSFPKQNTLQQDSHYLCTEALYAFFEIYAEQTGKVILFHQQLSITTPYKLYKYLKTVL